MRANLKLDDPRWKSVSRREALSAAVNFSAAELVEKIKLKISTSRPAGRTYRVGSIRRKATRRNDLPGLAKRGNKRIVGSTFYRASARGQPPAIRHGRLINSIQAVKLGELKSRVFSSVGYARPLDDPDYLNRPFFRSTAREYKPRFLANVRRAWTTGSF